MLLGFNYTLLCYLLAALSPFPSVLSFGGRGGGGVCVPLCYVAMVAVLPTTFIRRSLLAGVVVYCLPQYPRFHEDSVT